MRAKGCPPRNEDFCSRSRHAKKITAGICLIFRELLFEHNADIVQKDHLWMDTKGFVDLGTPSLVQLDSAESPF